jgi:hypothetical protein
MSMSHNAVWCGQSADRAVRDIETAPNIRQALASGPPCKGLSGLVLCEVATPKMQDVLAAPAAPKGKATDSGLWYLMPSRPEAIRRLIVFTRCGHSGNRRSALAPMASLSRGGSLARFPF